MQEISEYINQLTTNFVNLLGAAPLLAIITLQVILIIVIAYIINKLVVRYIRRASLRLELVPEVTNGLIMIIRIFILLAALAAISSVGGLPPDLFVSLSAIAGAAIGFAAMRTVGNFIAGIYLLITRPFKIKDYVRIGDVEGIIEEMSINYTKILTADGSTVLMSNQTILDSTITNFSRGEDLYTYPVPLSFDFSFTKNEIMSILNEVCSKFKKEGQIKDFNVVFVGLARLEQQYLINLLFEKAELIFDIPSLLLASVAERFDKLREPKAEKNKK